MTPMTEADKGVGGVAVVVDLLKAMSEIAPPSLAESWDNTGLLVGDIRSSMKRGLLCIDYTSEVARECDELGVDTVVAYHPTIFEPMRNLRAGDVVFEAVRAGRAIYCPHTALDLADGGTNDVLAEAIGMVSLQPLKPRDCPDSNNVKLVVFVPDSGVEQVADAMYSAGAGQIGAYRRCSFRSNGTGTFFGLDSANPVVGKAGRDERVVEVRLEVVVPVQRLGVVIDAMKTAHSYETPAYDVYRLVDGQQRGAGRFGTLAAETTVEHLVARLKVILGLSHVLVAGPLDKKIVTAACCAGSCGKLLDAALAKRADVYVTGEIKHHDALRAAAAGLTVICTLHSNSERATLPVLQKRLAKMLPQVQWMLSKADRDPLVVV